MRESRLYGSRRGARGNSRPYRERLHISSSLARPPSRGRVVRGYLVRPKRDEMAALVWVTTDLGAVLTSHVSFQLVDRGSSLASARCRELPSDEYSSRGSGLPDR